MLAMTGCDLIVSGTITSLKRSVSCLLMYFFSCVCLFSGGLRVSAKSSAQMASSCR